MQYFILILIMQIWFGIRIQMLWVEFLQKRLWELLLSNQGTAIEVLYFRNFLKLLKFSDKVLENVLLIGKFINSLLPPIFNNWFTFCSNIHNYETTSSATSKLFQPFRTNLYGKNSITVNTIDAWNIKLKLLLEISFLRI